MTRLNNSVQAQIERDKEQMLECAKAFRHSTIARPWLDALLASRGQSKESGALVLLDSTPEQSGELYRGIWINHERKFFSFTAVASYATSELIDVEEWRDVTDSTDFNAHVPGIGKSFGQRAIETLDELQSSEPA